MDGMAQDYRETDESIRENADRGFVVTDND